MESDLASYDDNNTSSNTLATNTKLQSSLNSIDFLTPIDVKLFTTQNSKSFFLIITFYNIFLLNYLEMLMHTIECIQEMTKACDKLLGARNLV